MVQELAVHHSLEPHWAKSSLAQIANNRFCSVTCIKWVIYYLFGGGWAQPTHPGCCLATVPRAGGVQIPSGSLSGPEAGLKTAELAKPGLHCHCPLAVHVQEPSFPCAVDLVSLLSTIIHLKRNWRGKKEQLVLFTWYSVMECKMHTEFCNFYKYIAIEFWKLVLFAWCAFRAFSYNCAHV